MFGILGELIKGLGDAAKGNGDIPLLSHAGDIIGAIGDRVQGLGRSSETGVHGAIIDTASIQSHLNAGVAFFRGGFQDIADYARSAVTSPAVEQAYAGPVQNSRNYETQRYLQSAEYQAKLNSPFEAAEVVRPTLGMSDQLLAQARASAAQGVVAA